MELVFKTWPQVAINESEYVTSLPIPTLPCPNLSSYVSSTTWVYQLGLCFFYKPLCCVLLQRPSSDSNTIEPCRHGWVGTKSIGLDFLTYVRPPPPARLVKMHY